MQKPGGHLFLPPFTPGSSYIYYQTTSTEQSHHAPRHSALSSLLRSSSVISAAETDVLNGRRYSNCISSPGLGEHYATGGPLLMRHQEPSGAASHAP